MGSRAEARKGKAEQLEAAVKNQQSIVNMPSSRWTWTRPTTHIYSYNREAQNILGSRSARATSVAATESRSALTSTSESNVRSSRAASVAASSDSFQGYSGYYGRQMALIMQCLTDSAMSYKSSYSKSASQMAREAMEACEQEAASSKKVRRTVVEESSRRVVAA